MQCMKGAGRGGGGGGGEVVVAQVLWEPREGLPLTQPHRPGPTKIWVRVFYIICTTSFLCETEPLGHNFFNPNSQVTWNKFWNHFMSLVIFHFFVHNRFQSNGNVTRLYGFTFSLQKKGNKRNINQDQTTLLWPSINCHTPVLVTQRKFVSLSRLDKLWRAPSCSFHLKETHLEQMTKLEMASEAWIPKRPAVTNAPDCWSPRTSFSPLSSSTLHQICSKWPGKPLWWFLVWLK